MNSQNAQETVWDGRYLSMVSSDGWEYVTRKTQRPGVGIVAVTDDRRIILVEQYRTPVGRKVVELPAGLAGDVVGAEDEPFLAAAKRELMEETGYTATRWTELGRGYSSPGLTDESIVLFLAEGLEKRGQGGGDESESITVHEVPLDQVIGWMDEKRVTVDLKLMAGLFAAQRHLRLLEEHDV